MYYYGVSKPASLTTRNGSYASNSRKEIMKIIEENVWIGHVQKCEHCRTVFKLQKEDAEKVKIRAGYFWTNCPKCGENCQIIV